MSVVHFVLFEHSLVKAFDSCHLVMLQQQDLREEDEESMADV